MKQKQIGLQSLGKGKANGNRAFNNSWLLNVLLFGGWDYDLLVLLYV